MLPQWLWALLTMLQEAWSARRSRQIQFLRLQVELLRQKTPGNRVILCPDDRQRLLQMGASLGHRVDDLLGIVSVKTYRRWLRDGQAGRQPRNVGRRRVIPPSLRALIVRMGKENTGWGARRIVGELRKLALTPSRSTVRRVMAEEGLPPSPDRRAPKGTTTPWRLFVQSHLNTMVACDFLCKTVRGWTPLGKQVAYALVFIHMGTRKVSVSPATYEPDEAWVNQQARNTLLWLEDEGLEVTHVLHDRDTKFCASFDRLLESAGIKRVRSPIQLTCLRTMYQPQ